MIVMPDTQSMEKQETLRLGGADLKLVPAQPYKDPGNYVRVSERLAKTLAESEPNGVLWANQWDNPANRAAHYQGTGPEIWRQTDGKVDAFVSAIGTGGTLSGVGMFLKEQNPDVRIVLADPPGSAMYSHFAHGELKAEGSSITEGIGQGRITKNIEGMPVDDQLRISDEEAIAAIFDLAEHEGHILGGSSGVNIAGAIRAARDLFYTGEIGEEIVAAVQEGGGFLTMDDMASFHVGREAPETGTFTGPAGEFQVYTCGAWCQGPSFAEAIQILDGHDLLSMGHNSADYIHVLAETVKLSFADRDAFFGDPDMVDVPIKGLLDPSYASERRSQIDLEAAAPTMPPPGDPWRFEGRSAPAGYDYQPPEPLAAGTEGDTNYACVVDRWGNMFSATPSDTIGMAPLIRGLGFAPSGRGTQSWLDPRHPSALAPGKRPRLTPNALLAFKDGRPWMPFGTPGGDAQVQTTLQFFLNQAVFDMTPQQAAEAPRFQSKSFPDSFWPHAYYPGRLDLEGRIDPATAEELSRRGHLVNRIDDWARATGDVCGIALDSDTGTVTPASDLRADAYAMAR